MNQNHTIYPLICTNKFKIPQTSSSWIEAKNLGSGFEAKAWRVTLRIGHYSFFSKWEIYNIKWLTPVTLNDIFIEVKPGVVGGPWTGVNILHKICNCSEADCNCSGALKRNLFADNWKGFIAFYWNCYFYHTWFRFLAKTFCIFLSWKVEIVTDLFESLWLILSFLICFVK